MVSAQAAAAIVPDIATRVRRLEGAIRGSAGDILNPDSRLDDIIARLYALEGWANSAGHFGTPPAQGSNATYTVDQQTTYGDPA